MYDFLTKISQYPQLYTTDSSKKTFFTNCYNCMKSPYVPETFELWDEKQNTLTTE